MVTKLTEALVPKNYNSSIQKSSFANSKRHEVLDEPKNLNKAASGKENRAPNFQSSNSEEEQIKRKCEKLLELCSREKSKEDFQDHLIRESREDDEFRHYLEKHYEMTKTLDWYAKVKEDLKNQIIHVGRSLRTVNIYGVTKEET